MRRLHLEDRRDKRVASPLYVHAWTPSGFRCAGELELDEDGDRDVSAVFRYDQKYLADPAAYALDPLNMPLLASSFATDSANVVLGAIFDAAPDAWGRRVVRAAMDARTSAAAGRDRYGLYGNAFLRGADGIGALVLTPDPHTDLDAIVALSLAERPRLSQLEAAARAARQLERDGQVDDDLRDLLAGSWTIGGARPKAILMDDRPGAAPGSSVIVKFARADDPLPRACLEYATLRMAQDIGMATPRHDLLDVQGEPTLVIERFDRRWPAEHSSPPATLAPASALRRHYLSAMSLVSAQPRSRLLDTRFDELTFSWTKLMEIASRVCAHPAQARVEMFARLALNAAVGNTDDHLKNFGFLRTMTAPGVGHYEIAPVFDVSPQASPTHYLHCHGLGREYTLSDVIAQSRRLGVAQAAAAEIEDRIRSVLQRADEYLDEAGLTAAQRATARRWIERGTGPLGQAPRSIDRTTNAPRA
jgi:serine/threonine-protein kinase HipA